MMKFGQGFQSLSPPSKELLRLVLEQRVAHGGHPILRWNMDNIVVKEDEAGNIKPDKKKAVERIDGAVAAIMALDRALIQPKKPNPGIAIYDFNNNTVTRNGVTTKF